MQLLKGITLPPAAQGLAERLGGERRVALLGVGVGAVLLILGMAHWATRPSWVPVYSDLPLESVGQITDKLDEAAIDYKIENGGTVLMVNAEDLARARVTLARDGGLPDAGRPGLELFDQPSWGMTDFTQRINYRRALEGELERTIGTMRGVEAAQVHLAMDNSPSFRTSQRPIEASVVLKLSGGESPDPDVVRGIQHLVSSSVDGVEAERVTVLDDAGRMLSSANAPGSLASAASQELQTRREIEQYLEEKAHAIVAQVAGAGNVRIQVSADVSFDRVERTVETVDPDKQVVASEQRAEIIPGAEGGAGSTNSSATYLNSRTVETFQNHVGGVQRLSIAVLLNERAATGEAQAQAWTPEQLQRVERLVSSAVGIDAQRGDVISVLSIPFDGPVVVEEPMTAMTLVATFWQPALMALALLFAFIVALRVVRGLKAPEPVLVPQLAGGVPALVAADGEKETMVSEGGEERQVAEKIDLFPKDRVELSKATELRNQIADRIRQEPDEAARLVRAWLREA